MRAFRVQTISPTDAWLEAEEYHHAIRVDRLRVGDRFRALDGEGRHWVARIEAVDAGQRRARVTLLEPLPDPLDGQTLVLAVALIRRERLEWLVEKATELGVTHLYLLRTERTVRTSAYRRDRLERIAWEAAKQCGRADIPRLYDPRPLDAVLALPYPWVALEASGGPWKSWVQEGEGGPGVLVGPEGGWSEEELQQFRFRDIPMVSLGPLTLRTETAALVGLSGALMRAGERSGREGAVKNHKGGDVHDRSTPAGR